MQQAPFSPYYKTLYASPQSALHTVKEQFHHETELHVLMESKATETKEDDLTGTEWQGSYASHATTIEKDINPMPENTSMVERKEYKISDVVIIRKESDEDLHKRLVLNEDEQPPNCADDRSYGDGKSGEEIIDNYVDRYSEVGESSVEIIDKSVDIEESTDSSFLFDSEFQETLGDSFKCALTRSSLQNTLAYQYQDPFDLYQNYDDQPHYKSQFQNYIGHEIKFHKESSEIEEGELHGKQLRDEVYSEDLVAMVIVYRVWERGGLLATHIYLKLLKSCCRGLKHPSYAGMKFILKHKWKSKLLQSCSRIELDMDDICGDYTITPSSNEVRRVAEVSNLSVITFLVGGVETWRTLKGGHANREEKVWLDTLKLNQETEFSWSKNFMRLWCFTLEIYFGDLVDPNPYGNELLPINQNDWLWICHGNKKKKTGYKRVVVLTWFLDLVKLYLLQTEVKKDDQMLLLLVGISKNLVTFVLVTGHVADTRNLQVKGLITMLVLHLLRTHNNDVAKSLLQWKEHPPDQCYHLSFAVEKSYFILEDKDV